MKRKLLFLLLLPFCAFAQIPAYYSSIDFNQTGDNLKNQISTLIINTHTTEIPYTSSSTDVWDALKLSDLDPDNASNVLLFYGFDDSDAVTKNDRVRSKDDSCHSSSCVGLWNREHVFAKSLATPPLSTSDPGAGTDAHNLRACDGQMNSSRSNRAYEDGSGNATITANGNFYPGDEWKGDVARIIMYMYLRYPSRCASTDIGIGETTYSPNGDMPNIFLEWNEEDPVSEYELNRNVVLENIQGNRNPFIDNPYLATIIWNGPSAEDRWNTLSTEDFSLTQLDLYPTQTSDYVQISNPENRIFEYTVYNTSGQEVITTTSNDVVDLSDKQDGLYFVHMKTENSMKTIKIVKTARAN